MPAVLDWFRPKDRHAAFTEAAPGKTVALSPSKSVVRAGYTYGVPPGGLNDVQTGMGAATQTDRTSLLQELYEAYISCPWAWAARTYPHHRRRHRRRVAADDGRKATRHPRQARRCFGPKRR